VARSALRYSALGRAWMGGAQAADAGLGGRNGRRSEVAVSQTGTAHHRGLFAYPAQSNFSGVQHPLRWIEMAHERGFDVLLDAAAYVPSNRLDLSVVKPDFVPVSWYKVFGYPTGVGCRIARRKVLASLWRPWFAGGSAYLASVQNDRHTLAAAGARFEDGTLSFLQIPDLGEALAGQYMRSSGARH
jgi:selenocysteine lyase/cysteine desulfurase